MDIENFGLGEFAQDEEVLQEYKRQYDKHGFVQISDFLETRTAYTMYAWYHSEMPREWLTHAINAKEKKWDYRNLMTQEKSKEMKDAYRLALSEIEEGNFAYSFTRTTSHTDTCNCIECGLKKFLRTEEALAPIGQITGMSLFIDNIFGSIYQGGDFLTPHTDETRGTVSGALHLTKKWKPQWGGQTQIFDTLGNIKISATPSFNKLLLFKIPVTHQVTHIPESVSYKRYGMTLWWEDSNNLPTGGEHDDY